MNGTCETGDICTFSLHFKDAIIPNLYIRGLPFPTCQLNSDICYKLYRMLVPRKKANVNFIDDFGNSRMNIQHRCELSSLSVSFLLISSTASNLHTRSPHREDADFSFHKMIHVSLGHLA